jgi:hypothetical protein
MTSWHRVHDISSCLLWSTDSQPLLHPMPPTPRPCAPYRRLSAPRGATSSVPRSCSTAGKQHPALPSRPGPVVPANSHWPGRARPNSVAAIHHHKLRVIAVPGQRQQVDIRLRPVCFQDPRHCRGCSIALNVSPPARDDARGRNRIPGPGVQTLPGLQIEPVCGHRQPTAVSRSPIGRGICRRGGPPSRVAGSRARERVHGERGAQDAAAAHESRRMYI